MSTDESIGTERSQSKHITGDWGLGTVGAETMEGLEQIGLSKEMRKKLAKKMFKKVVKVNGQLFSMRFNEERRNRSGKEEVEK